MVARVGCEVQQSQTPIATLDEDELVEPHFTPVFEMVVLKDFWP
jgi:hypothetical protein